MASFFKCSCVIYWLAWLVCLSYLYGTSIFTSNFVEPGHATHMVFQYLEALCFFNCAWSVFGCIFVKCSITHILCAVSFVIPLVFVNLYLCIAGMMAVREVIPPDVNEIITEINYHYANGLELPNWFSNVQYWATCCGIYSYLDYALIFTNSSTLNGIIPQTCCPAENQNCYKLPLESTSSSLNDSTQNITEIMEDLESFCDNQAKAPYSNSNRTFRPIHNINHMISPCGCHNVIMEMSDSLYGSHFYFFLIFLFVALGEAFSYMKMWCRHKGSNADSGSEHSLDLDEMPTVRSLVETAQRANDSYHLHLEHIKHTLPLHGRTGSFAEGHTAQGHSVPQPHRLPATKAVTNFRRETVHIPNHKK